MRTHLPDWTSRWQSPMLVFARLHLSSGEDAEDVVQETWLAALQRAWLPEQLRDPRPYLFGILKHKVVDRLRRRYAENERQVSLPDDLDELLFDASGHWRDGMAAQAWSRPDEQLQVSRFFALVDACVQRLPAKAAKVFSMKELLECEADEVCGLLAITKADYWQSMSRARKQLQLCLNEKGFEGRCL